MRDFLIYADIDGVLTPCQKLFHCTRAGGSTVVEDRWYKTYSDRDSYVMLMMKDDLVFISNDKRNEHYASYKGHEFCYVSHAKDKYYGLAADWGERVQNGEVDGDPFTPRYFYIGDAPFDWLCLKNSIHGFLPADCSTVLFNRALPSEQFTRLSEKGGEGCLEGMMYNMSIRLNKFPMVADLPVIKAIREFIDGDV